MDKVWERIFKKNIESFYAIETLYHHNVIGMEEVKTLKLCLLDDIIATMKSEVEE